MGLWEDFTDTISRGFDQVNPWDNGKDWNNRTGNVKKKKDEERVVAPQVSQPNFRMQAQMGGNDQRPQLSQPDFKMDAQKPVQFGQVDDSFQARQSPLPEVGTDGAVEDRRPLLSRVPGDATSQANSALKAATQTKDKDNYIKSDADKLRAELMKPNPDKAIVQGLTQSVRNRTSERERAAPEEARIATVNNPLVIAQEVLKVPTDFVKGIVQPVFQQTDISNRLKQDGVITGQPGIDKLKAFVDEDERNGLITKQEADAKRARLQGEADKATASLKKAEDAVGVKYDQGAGVMSAIDTGTLGIQGLIKGGISWGLRELEKKAGRALSEMEVQQATQNLQKILAENAPTNIAQTVAEPKKGVIQIINNKEGTKRYISPDDANYEQAVKEIDNQRTANGDANNGIAGTPQANGDIYHITARTPEEMEARGFTRDTPPTTAQQLVDDAKPTGLSKQSQALIDELDSALKQRKNEDLADAELELERLQAQIMDATTPDSQLSALSRQARELKKEVEEMKRGATPKEELAKKTMAQQAEREKMNLIPSGTIDEQGNLINTQNGEYLNSYKPEQTPSPTLDGLRNEPTAIQQVLPTPKTELGKIADTFYESRKGNTKIKFSDLTNLGKSIEKEITRTFNEIGSSFDDVARKTQLNEANKLPYNQGLTKAESDLWDKVQSEMDYVRRRGSLGKREISTKDRGQGYFPHQLPDAYSNRDTMLAGFRDVQPGNEISRKSGEQGLDLDALDYSPKVVGQYVTRYGDTKLLNEERIARAVEKNNPDAQPEAIDTAVKSIVDLQDRVNNLKTKINAGGFGNKVTVSNGKVIDFAQEMSQVGKTLGRPQTQVIGTPRGFTNGERINSVLVDNKPLGDVIGLNQHRDAGTFAGTHTVDAAGDRDVLAGMVQERLKTQYNLPEEDINYLVDGIARIKSDVPEEVVKARVASTYANAAKQQMMEQLQNLDIANPKLRKDVSDLANQMVREGTIEAELSAKVTQNILRAQNALFRKLNVSSAMNELSDLTSFSSVFGKDMAVGMATPDYSLIGKYNLGDLDPAIEPYIRQIKEGADVKGVMKAFKAGNQATNFYRFVEHYKAASFLTAAERHYAKKGLMGDALTDRILKDYRNLALPQDAFTRTFLNNVPLYTQYMSWGARNLQKEVRLATGKIDAGVLSDKSTAARVARNLYANMPAKTAFWLASNGLKGTAILTAFGVTDFTGMTSQDYSGIAEEDKSWYDNTTKFTNMSTTMSLLNTIVQSYEKEGLKEKYKDADYNPYENNNFGETVAKTYTPQFIKNATGAQDLMDKGYSENAAGRVQYEAPTDPIDQAKAYIFGKNQTENAREYGGRQNLMERMNNGQDILSAMSDMAREQLGNKDNAYNRPLNDKYTAEYKKLADGADKALATAMLDGGRKYNTLLDDLKKNSPDGYNRYISGMDGNHVSPEYWKTIAGDGSDLTVFKTVADRKKQLLKDMGTAYDPLYDLPDDQVKSVLQLKSAPTGDDIALRNMLGKEGWYKDYKKKINEFYANKDEPATESEFKETDRVKQWNALDDQLQSFYYDKASGETPVWAEKYPLVLQSKSLEFDSPESKAFYKANYDAYKAQKEAFDRDQLAVINQMRKIEGHPEMGWEQYQQATNFADTDGTTKKSGYGSGGGSGGTTAGIKGSDFGRGGGSNVNGSLQTIKIKQVARKARVRAGTKNGKIIVKKGKMI